jgi:large subunit ribosomal protein L9
MKVLLRQNIDKVGKRGEIVTVSDGYARNYLFPKKLAVEPTPQNLKQLDIEKRRYLQQETELRKNLEALAEQLKQVSVTLVARADQDGHLYGSVTDSMITEALSEQKIKVETRCVEMEKPIKDLGVYNVDIRLHPEIVTQIKVWVVEESGGEELPAEAKPESKPAKGKAEGVSVDD